MAENLSTPHSLLRAGLGLVLCALVLASPTLAAPVTYGDIKVALESEPRGQAFHGYTEYRILVQNTSSDRKHVVTLQYPGNTISGRRGGGGGLRSISTTVDVEPGRLRIVSLLQPAAPDVLGNGLVVYVDGRKQEDQVALTPVAGRGGSGVSFGRHRGYYPHHKTSKVEEPSVLTSQRVPEKLFKVARAHHGVWAPGMGIGIEEKREGGAGVLDPAPPVVPAPPGGAAGGAGGPPAVVAPGPPMIGGGMVRLLGTPPEPRSLNAEVSRSEIPISSWSSRWLAFTRHDMIVVTREDVEELERGSSETRAILQALWQYTEAGGTLLVLGPGTIKVPAVWSRFAEKGELAVQPQAPDQPRFGVKPIEPGRPIVEAPGPRPAKDGKKAESATLYRAGFGACIVTPDRDSAKWEDSRWRLLDVSLSTSAQPWRNTGSRGMMDLNNRFPVIDSLGVPVRGLFALLLVFGIAIGPLNLAVLARKNKRIWLLWTVPALSAVFCLAVMGYMVAAEGWQGHSRVAGLTILDEIDRRATTLGNTAYYSPLTPGDGLRFSPETEVQIQGDEHAAFGSQCSLDWTGDQHLSRGWVTARVPAHFTVRKSEPRRERITLRRDSDGLRVVNALGTTIRTLWLADDKGMIWTAGPITPDSPVKLEPAGRVVRKEVTPARWRQVYGNGNWPEAIESAIRTPENLLVVNSYLAVVEESPFLEQGLKGARARACPSVVLGLMADPTGR